VFGVDDGAVQLTWRRLGAGPLRIRSLTDDVELDVVIDEPGDAGADTLEGLPPGRLLRFEASSPALSEPVVLTARTLAALPGEELSRFATVSDLHLGARSFGHRGTILDPFDHAEPHPVRCAAAALDETVAWGAERIVVKGDLTNGAQPHEWRRYAEQVHRLPVPVDALPGNHDHGPTHIRGHLHPPQAAEAFGLSIAAPVLVRDLPGVRIVLGDTTLEGAHGGHLGAVRSDLLDAAAEADPAGGVVVALHHQLQPNLLPEGWPPGIAHRASLDLLDDLGAAHPHVLVTSGHTHRHRRWGRAGVVVTQVGSTKDFPGVWAGYVVHEGGLRQIVRRVQHPDAIAWNDHTRVAAFGLWEHAAPGRLDARCFNVAWRRPT
jgi:3',5'-cyclic AMP phosphodiesterase CpdA